MLEGRRRNLRQVWRFCASGVDWVRETASDFDGGLGEGRVLADRRIRVVAWSFEPGVFVPKIRGMVALV